MLTGDIWSSGFYNWCIHV